MRQLVVLLSMLLLLVGCQGRQVSSQPSEGRTLPPPGNPLVGDKPPVPGPVRLADPPYKVETFVSGLEVPWDMAFTPDGRIYITERPGRVRLVVDGKLRPQPYAVISGVRARGEGGLMGIALHPKYPDPRWLYLMYTSGGGNRISRFTDTGSGLTDEQPVVTEIPMASFHDGGVIRFGPDQMLYIGTGDAGEPERAQDLSSLAGKILRVTPEGKVPPDNPFPNSMVYACGLRNVQGLAWNPSNGDLWCTMHGPSGEFGLSAKDEVFIVRKGGNHGWPRTLGVTDVRGVEDPVLFFPDVAVAPSGAVFYSGSLMPDLKGSFFFATLRGEHLERVVLSGPRTISRIERWFEGKYGRLRAVVQGRDGALYVSTSNQDGRGSVHPGDDRILRIGPR